MCIWIYCCFFYCKNYCYEIKYLYLLISYIFRLYKEGKLIDELIGYFIDEFKVFIYIVCCEDVSNILKVLVGYINWLIVGIEVYQNDKCIYVSYLGKDIYFVDRKL